MKKSRYTFYNILGKARRIKSLAVSLVILATFAPALTSCVADNEANSMAVRDYKDDDVKSYGDLFEVFWNVMNQRYCDLNEQPSKSTVDWDQIYADYKPKFDTLKTFKPTYDFTQAEILADNSKAKQYFKEIVGSLIDQHFYLNVTLPVSYTATETVKFRSTLRQRDDRFPLSNRQNYIESLLCEDGSSFSNSTSDGFCIVGGFLKDHQDTYYLGFSNFYLSQYCVYTYEERYLPINEESTYHLNQHKIDSVADNTVDTEARRTEVKREAATIVDGINQYFAADNVTTLCQKIAAYRNNGDCYGMNDCARTAISEMPSLLKRLTLTKEVDKMAEEINRRLDLEDCATLRSESNFRQWFSRALAEYLLYEREYYAYWRDLQVTYTYPTIENYRRYFLDPLKNGKINKLILDLRSNTGGFVSDTRIFTDYLVSHTATYSYGRKKENNNPYGYTPWIPQQIVVTNNSLKRDIPTAILIDNWSASMGEVTPLMLRSQGEHVKTIGRNSCGAQCMLFPDNTINNGGWVGNVTSYLYFYMPIMLTKDVNGNILESVGITPDYAVDAMTKEELDKIKNADSDAKDRDLEKAIEVLHQ